MKQITPLLIACLALGLLSSLALADHHGKKQDKTTNDEGWTLLIGEEDLAGWSAKDRETYWKFEDGMIVGANPDQKESRLWTDKEYGDYELTLEYKTASEEYDSGIYLRGSSHQVQIGISRSQHVDLTGALYCPKDGNGKYPQMSEETQKTIKEAHQLDAWNTLRVVTKGNHIMTYLNGEVINDYEGVKYVEKGKIGLQLHSNLDMKIYFRNIKLRAISGE